MREPTETRETGPGQIGDYKTRDSQEEMWPPGFRGMPRFTRKAQLEHMYDQNLWPISVLLGDT